MSETIIQTTVLEPAAQAFVEATANPPYLFDLGPVEGRHAHRDAHALGEQARHAIFHALPGVAEVDLHLDPAGVAEHDSHGRSEERRVGKECHVVSRSRWSPNH